MQLGRQNMHLWSHCLFEIKLWKRDETVTFIEKNKESTNPRNKALIETQAPDFLGTHMGTNIS